MIDLLAVSAVTYVGATRKSHEDCIAIAGQLLDSSSPDATEFRVPIDRPRVILAADGMGGHAGGAVASRIVAMALARLDRIEGVDEIAVEREVVAANEALYLRMRDSPELQGMGSTVAGCVFLPDGTAIVFNVGDSRCYRYREGFLEQLTHDDAAQASGDGLLTQALGGTRSVQKIDIHLTRVGARPNPFLIATDGLTRWVGIETLEQSFHSEPQAQVTELLGLAQSLGSDDNISLAVVRYL